MRWIWIDRFIEFTPRQQATAVKNLSLAEDHFEHHFPGYPVMPASLMLEGLAQTGGILVGEANDFQEKVVLAKIAKAQFHREVLAGETLHYHTTIIDLRPEGATIQGRVSSAGEQVGEAEIMFIHLDRNRAGAIFGDDNFVFSGELRKLLGLSRLPPAPTAGTAAPTP
ncbi:MAG TPA: 3-hydroxyacyl-ACP dehydratase FabZ family protein [Gemmatales bacterium]|nr:3-hydroxyacyl-ACP dehydratase FabZ family protein [Gemmatales bacterium]HMP59181.1 3-hydroxyacyl-ACP dehydratase FabZ family protein [Gemmatales bacterium]